MEILLSILFLLQRKWGLTFVIITDLDYRDPSSLRTGVSDCGPRTDKDIFDTYYFPVRGEGTPSTSRDDQFVSHQIQSRGGLSLSWGHDSCRTWSTFIFGLNLERIHVKSLFTVFILSQRRLRVVKRILKQRISLNSSQFLHICPHKGHIIQYYCFGTFVDTQSVPNQLLEYQVRKFSYYISVILLSYLHKGVVRQIRLSVE